MRHTVHYKVKAPDADEEYHIKVRRLHYPSHRAKKTKIEERQMKIVNFLREQKVSCNQYIEPGVISKDRFQIMVSKVVHGKQMTDELLFDKKAV